MDTSNNKYYRKEGNLPSDSPSSTPPSTSRPTDSSTTLSTQPFDIAILYTFADTSGGCSHEIPWDANTLIGLQQCPICMTPVGMVCDGLVASVEKESRDNDNKVGRIVRFKFGKKLYQLSTTGMKPQQQVSLQNSYTIAGWLGSFWGKTQNASTNDKCTTTMLAQSRIAQALNLASLKILHKGKILYPPHHSEPIQEAAISRALLKISDEHWNNCKDNKKKKVALIVMGTSKEGQLKESSKDNRKFSNSSVLQGFQPSIWFPVRILCWSVQLSWHLVTSFFAPFLPSYMLGGEGNASGDRNTRHTQPHQD
mmetsp:Transcript_7831/g.17488  ORF Transcript_7831/g.17488 Transcript_7831/m.17488 type:complete len:310 (+) Transcript_7831:265-1194(+)